MGNYIETTTATLDMLSVTIRALHVNGKQMTLAVFRQLPTIAIYNKDGSLAPIEFWGIVRYAIKDQGDIWVVCAHQNRLYRGDLWSFENNSVNRINDILIKRKSELEFAKKDIDWYYDCKKRVDSACDGRGDKVWKEGSFYDSRNRNYIKWYDQIGRRDWSEGMIDDLKENLFNTQESIEYWLFCLDKAKRFESSKETLLNLPQLFIAV